METYFFDMIKHVRSKGEVLLYQHILDIESSEIERTISFLKSEYENERISYPFVPPEFCPDSAIWAAKLFYFSSQLLLYREQNTKEISTLIYPFDKDISPGAILSADLTLRFIPDIIGELKIIDDSDPLIDILEEILRTCHYSAIGYRLPDIQNLDFTIIRSNQCLTQLYIDRMIDRNTLLLAQQPGIHKEVETTLGIYKKELWEKFE